MKGRCPREQKRESHETNSKGRLKIVKGGKSVDKVPRRKETIELRVARMARMAAKTELAMRSDPKALPTPDHDVARPMSWRMKRQPTLKII